MAESNSKIFPVAKKGSFWSCLAAMQQSEMRNLLRHSLKKGKIISLAVFFAKKAWQRHRFKQVNYGWNYYPQPLKKLIQPFLKEKINLNWMLPVTSNTEPPATAFAPTRIQLASRDLELQSADIPFTQTFHDPEDEESLHRWNWLLTLESKTAAAERQALALWAIRQIRRWKESFSAEIDGLENHGTARWESYTVGERMANTVLFFKNTGRRPPDDVLELLDSFTRFLLPHMEFKGHLSGNHVLNNARALYLVARATGTGWLHQIASRIIFEKLDELTSPDGFMREGSSHYQFLFTCWVLDLKTMAALTGDKAMSDFLQPRLEQLEKACRFFLVSDPSASSVVLPCFGDISPDFTPEWLLRHLQNHLFQNTIPQNNLAKIQSSFTQKSSTGWHRFEHGPHRILLRADSRAIPEHVGHHHNDFYHFCYFWNGKAILVDLGRLNYRMDDPLACFGLTPMAHNSVLIDDCGVTPHLGHRYPSWYAQAENRISSDANINATTIGLSSTGFNRLRGHPEFKRSITLFDTRLEMTDLMSGKGQHGFEIWLHFDPLFKLKQKAEMIFSLSSRDMIWNLQIECPEKISFDIFQNQSSGAGRQVKQYGQYTSCHSLKMTGLFRKKVGVKTTLSPEKRLP